MLITIDYREKDLIDLFHMKLLEETEKETEEVEVISGMDTLTVNKEKKIVL